MVKIAMPAGLMCRRVRCTAACDCADGGPGAAGGHCLFGWKARERETYMETERYGIESISRRLCRHAKVLPA